MARRKSKYKNIIIFAVIVVAVALCVQLKIFERQVPQIYMQDIIYTNFKEPLPVRIVDELSGIKSVKITLKKDSKDDGIVLYDERANNQKEVVLELNLPTIIKSTDSYTLEILAKDSSFWHFFAGNSSVKNVPIIADTKKPAVNILSNSYQIEQGGVGAVVFEARDENLQELYIENDKGRKFKVLPYLQENHYGALIAWSAVDKDFRAFVVSENIFR